VLKPLRLRCVSVGPDALSSNDMNSTSLTSSTRFAFGVSCLVALVAFIAIGVRQRQLSFQLDALRAERQMLASQQKQTEASLDRVEAMLAEWEGRRPRGQPLVAPLERGMHDPAPGIPTQPSFRSRLGGVVSRSPRSPTVVLDEPAPPPSGNPARRPWGHEQALGPPDTSIAGDQVTAWASREPDGGPEWLRLGFGKAVDIAEVRIRETYNPGAISRVAAIVDGQDRVLWEGVEEVAPAPGTFLVPVSDKVVARTIVVHLDTTRVPGWNEIDAVELVGKDGSRQWAQTSSASSSFADNQQPAASATSEPIEPIPAPAADRTRRSP